MTGKPKNKFGSGSKVTQKPAVKAAEVPKKPKCVELIEDCFGTYVDEAGARHKIQRFTWKNQNNIKVQVITYGARVTSMVVPSRKGVLEDIVMGFDDIAGYLHYDDLHAGGTIGRTTNRIENATFALDGKQFWLSSNDQPHHKDGGLKGLDKVPWVPYVKGNQLMLSYVSRDLEEGYPGDLLVRTTFELTSKNEFEIKMEAMTTKPTIVDLSSLLYFNLAGHGAGAQELYNHIVSVNSNCFISINPNGAPTGEILNVIYSGNDFQIPKLLKKEMGLVEGDGFDVHFCINRGMDQERTFVARALHPASGRVLEVYSNQHGVHFSTANDLGYGLRDIPVGKAEKVEEETDSLFGMITRLHESAAETLGIDGEADYSELRALIRKLAKFPVASEDELEDVFSGVVLKPMQVCYLEAILEASKKRDSATNYAELEKLVQKLLESVGTKSKLDVSGKSESVQENPTEKNSGLQQKGLVPLGNNTIPPFYMDGRIHGKNNAIYGRHGFMCFQTENYPGSVHHKEFPNCKLYPGEVYKHEIVYKFWLQSGDPNKWLKKNCPK